MLEPHSPLWTEELTALQRVYAAALGDLLIGIEHVGSTAVPDLEAKPILDIDLVIAGYEVFPRVVAALESLGYRHNGDQGIPQREAFKRGYERVPRVEPPRTWMHHHLYVCPTSSPELKRHVLFRDALRKSAALRREYEKLKRALAAQAGGDRKAYAQMKETTCREFVESALGTTMAATGVCA